MLRRATTTMTMVMVMVMVVMMVMMDVQAQTPTPTPWKKGFDNSVCVQQPDNPGTKLPNLPESFSMRVEANILNKMKTTTLHEYYNYDANVAAVKQVDDGGEHYFFYLYNTNQYLEMEPDSHGGQFCFRQDLANSVNQDMFGLTKVNSSSDRIYSVLGALHFTGNNNENYMGQETVRGILTNKWHSCQYWKELDATSDVYWYFSDESHWSSISGYPAPVRCHVKGIRWMNSTFSYPYEHIYEFYDFQSDIDRMNTHFEVPRNTYCYLETNTKPLPTLTPAYTFNFETVDLNSKTISFAREEYDNLTKLLRYDYRDAPLPNSPHSSRYMSEIHDFNTGVAYIIDVLGANCTVTPIGQHGFDDITMTNGDVRMRNPKEFLDLDHPYVYQGVRTTRGIECDTWATKRFDYPDPTINNPVTVWTWYFATTKWMKSMGFRTYKSLPVMLEIFGDSPQQPMHKQISYYEYNTDEPDLLSWDLSPCYSTSQSRNYAFLVQGRFRDVVANDLKTFKYFVVMSLQLTLQISPLRITKVDVQEAGSNTLVTFDLLDKAPIQGDVANKLNEPSLVSAYNTLNYMVHHDQMKILLSDNGVAGFNQKRVLPAGPEYQVGRQSSAPNSDNSSSGFSAGAMGGIAVGMLIAGALVGFFIIFIVYRIRGGSLGRSDVPLQKFGNENEG